MDTTTIAGREVRIRPFPRTDDQRAKAEATRMWAWQKGKHNVEPCEHCGARCTVHYSKPSATCVFTLDGGQMVHPDDVAWCVANMIDYVGLMRIGTSCARSPEFRGWVVKG